MKKLDIKNRFSLVIGAALIATGCAGFESETAVQTALKNVDEGQKVEDITRPVCEVDYADYELDMHLYAFQMKDKTDFSVGFNLLQGFFKAIGLKFKTERGQMEMTVELGEALRPLEVVAKAKGVGELKGTEFRIDLDALQLGLDIGYYYKTPLSTLTEKTVKNGLSEITKKLKNVETPWNSRVVFHKPVEQEMIIPAGSVAGLRLGDEFYVYNVNYIWKDTPCASDLQFRDRDATHVARVVVTQLEKNASMLTIVDKPSDAPIELGALVEVAHLPLAKGEKSRSLARSVRLRNVVSEKLSVQGASAVDFTLYLREQTTALLNFYGFYQRK